MPPRRRDTWASGGRGLRGCRRSIAKFARRAVRPWKMRWLQPSSRRQRKRLPKHDWICGKASRSGATTKTIGRGARAVMTIAKTRSNASVWSRGVSDSLPDSTAKESPSCSLRTGTKMSVSSCVYRAQRPEACATPSELLGFSAEKGGGTRRE